MNKSAVNTPFNVGDKVYLITDFVPPDLYNLIRKKFLQETDVDFHIGLLETVRFLYLCAHSNRSLFFPGDKLIDLIWHALVTETVHYRLICSRIKHGCFIDHSGIKYQDYISSLNSTAVHEEQFSWLASYVNTFGHITPEAFEHLPLARAIAKRLEVDLLGLNIAAKEIASAATNNNAIEKSHDFNSILNNRLRPNLFEADRSPFFVAELIEEIFSSLRLNRSTEEIITLNPEQLELILGISPPFGFTLWQHISAVERLSTAIEWQKKNPFIWNKIRNAEELVGLATTHLASPNETPLEGRPTSDGGYALNGRIPWASGKGYFTHLVVGFKSDDRITFALISFPKEDVLNADQEIKIINHQLEVCNSTDSVSIYLKNLKISPEMVISSTIPTGKVQPRQSSYKNPEVGIAKEILRRTLDYSYKHEHPKLILVRSKAEQLRKKLDDLCIIEEPSAQNWTKHKISLEIEKLIYDSIKLLLIAQGSISLKLKSETLLLQSQLSLLHSWVQNSDLIKLKIEALGE